MKLRIIAFTVWCLAVTSQLNPALNQSFFNLSLLPSNHQLYELYKKDLIIAQANNDQQFLKKIQSFVFTEFTQLIHNLYNLSVENKKYILQTVESLYLYPHLIFPINEGLLDIFSIASSAIPSSDKLIKLEGAVVNLNKNLLASSELLSPNQIKPVRSLISQFIAETKNKIVPKLVLSKGRRLIEKIGPGKIMALTALGLAAGVIHKKGPKLSEVTKEAQDTISTKVNEWLYGKPLEQQFDEAAESGLLTHVVPQQIGLAVTPKIKKLTQGLTQLQTKLDEINNKIVETNQQAKELITKDDEYDKQIDNLDKELSNESLDTSDWIKRQDALWSKRKENKSLLKSLLKNAGKKQLFKDREDYKRNIRELLFPVAQTTIEFFVNLLKQKKWELIKKFTTSAGTVGPAVNGIIENCLWSIDVTLEQSFLEKIKKLVQNIKDNKADFKDIVSILKIYNNDLTLQINNSIVSRDGSILFWINPILRAIDLNLKEAFNDRVKRLKFEKAKLAYLELLLSSGNNEDRIDKVNNFLKLSYSIIVINENLMSTDETITQLIIEKQELETGGTPEEVKKDYYEKLKENLHKLVKDQTFQRYSKDIETFNDMSRKVSDASFRTKLLEIEDNYQKRLSDIKQKITDTWLPKQKLKIFYNNDDKLGTQEENLRLKRELDIPHP